LDTNVFLTATDAGRPLRRNALFALEQWPSQGVRTYTCTQVLREYLVVATRPSAAGGLGMALGDAFSNIDQFASAVQVLPETLKTWDQLRVVLAKSALSGVRIHDANIAACALANGISTILTANVADFGQLPVATVDLASLLV